MNLRVVILAVLVFAVVPTASATSFVVPTDEQLVAKSAAIVIGTVESSQVQQANGVVETVFEIRIEGTLKGEPRPSDALRVVSPGGVLSGNRGVLVPAAARFRPGERVLVF